MKYLELCIDTPESEIDARCERMAELGAGGFVIENESDFRQFLEQNRQYWDYVDESLEAQYKGVSRIKCYLTDDEEGRAVLDSIKREYDNVRVSTVQDSDWENNWRQYYKPIETGKKLVIVPQWEEIPQDGRLPLILDPGLIFGTGSHPTTRMCLEALEDYASPDARVLDLGCGSGILGIGALILGCKSCLGCDIDPKAPDVVRSNAALNGMGEDRLTVCAGDVIGDRKLQKSFGGGYDIVLANIVADVIIKLSETVRQFMAKGGVFICSGIIDSRHDEVRRTLIKNGFTIVRERNEEEWYCYECK